MQSPVGPAAATRRRLPSELTLPSGIEPPVASDAPTKPVVEPATESFRQVDTARLEAESTWTKGFPDGDMDGPTVKMRGSPFGFSSSPDPQEVAEGSSQEPTGEELEDDLKATDPDLSRHR